MKKIIAVMILMLPLLMPSPAMAALDKADNAFMMLCTALVLMMSIPGIALFYGGLLRAKNVLSLLTQVLASFSLVSVLWVLYGYSLAFGEGNDFWGNLNGVLLTHIQFTDVSDSISSLVHVAFQGSFACITVGLIVGGFAERMRFSAVMLFVFIWFTLAYLPMAHMVWGGGYLEKMGAIDFAGGTVVHINAAVAALMGAYQVGRRRGFGRDAFKPHNLPMVFIGTAILYIGWFGFNAGSAGSADHIAALAFVNTITATAGAVLSWLLAEALWRGKPSLLGACSGCIAGLVAITPAAGSISIGGALLLGVLAGLAGLWGVLVLKKWLKADDTCDVFGVHGVCGIVGCLATGVLTSTALGGTGYEQGVSLLQQVGIQAASVVVCVLWSGVVAWVAYKIADLCVGLRVSEDDEREGLDINSHGESAYN